MKNIPCKIVQETIDGVTSSVIYPAQTIPKGVRVLFDGTQYVVMETKAEETAVIDSNVTLKQVTDDQKKPIQMQVWVPIDQAVAKADDAKLG